MPGQRQEMTTELAREFREAVAEAIRKNDLQIVSDRFGGPPVEDDDGKPTKEFTEWLRGKAREMLTLEIAGARKVEIVSETKTPHYFIEVKIDHHEVIYAEDDARWLKAQVMAKLNPPTPKP